MMAENPEKIIQFLLSRHIISPPDLVDTGLSLLADVRDRFVLSTLSIGGRPSFMIKQPRYANGIEGVHQEIRVYHCLGNIAELLFIAPALVADDFQRGLLVLQWVENDIHGNMPISQEEMAMRLGIGVGRLHAYTKETISEIGSLGRPWVLSSLGRRPKWRPPEIDIALSRIDQIDRDIMIRGLKSGFLSWQPDALIHGDLKREHNLVDSSQDSGPVCFLDWELASYGDTAWDVASIISDIMFDKQYGCGPDVDPAQKIVQTEEVVIFLRNYIQERPVDREFLKRVSLYAGARLFQTCLESASIYGVGEESGVDILLSMAVDVFDDPHGFSAVLAQGGM